MHRASWLLIVLLLSGCAALAAPASQASPAGVCRAAFTDLVSGQLQAERALRSSTFDTLGGSDTAAAKLVALSPGAALFDLKVVDDQGGLLRHASPLMKTCFVYFTLAGQAAVQEVDIAVVQQADRRWWVQGYHLAGCLPIIGC